MSKWEMVKLVDVCKKIFAGGDVPKNNYSLAQNEKYSVPIFTNGEQNNGLYGYTTTARVIEPSITVSARGTIGFTAIRLKPFYPAIRLITLTPNGQIDLRYLYYVTQNYKFDNGGTSIPQLTVPMLKNYSFPLPPKDIQLIIAKQFDKVTHTIDLCNAIIKKLDLLVKARFVEMFGDIYTNKRNFPVQQLADYIDFLTSGSRGWAKYCVDDGSEWFITIKNVKDCRISTDNIQPINAPDNMEAKRTKVEEGDLLISITADLGRTGVVTREIAKHGAYINQHLTCIRLNKTKLIPLYVAYFMESESGTPQFEAKNQTGVKAGLNFDSIKSLKLLVPPLALQKQFAAFVEQTEKTKAAVQKALDESQVLFDSLMQEYFG